MAPTPPARHAQVGGRMLNEIFEAASDGNLPRFKLLVMLLDMGRGRLREAVEALRVGDEGMMKGVSALHVAAIRGRLEICRYLVEELGVDVNVVDETERLCFLRPSPIMLAVPRIFLIMVPIKTNPVMMGSPHYIKQLYQDIVKWYNYCSPKEHTLDPEAYCGTPLHVAATKDQDGAMKILLDHKADVNKMVNGKTPMIAAIDADSRKCMLLLYKAGADRKEALKYAAQNLCAERVVSRDFVKCVLEDASNMRIVPGDEPIVKRETRKDGLQAIASYAFKAKDFESAERYYSLMIALDPEDATAFSNRSLCWLLMGDGRKALFDANECRKRRPDWPKACYRQGAALMFLKDYKRACERFSYGLKLDPGNAEIEDALRKASDELQKMSGSTKPK